MASYRWPTDPPGKAPAHTVSWQQHQTNLKAKSPTATAPGGAPALAQPLPMPVDPLYSGDVGLADRNYQQTMGSLTTGRQAGLAEYGFNEDPTTKALAFDPNNPFSKAALLKQNYDTSRVRTGNQMAAGGQLYSGAYQNSQDLINRNQLQGEDQLQKSLTAWLSENTGAQARAGIDRDSALQSAEGNRVGRIPSNPLYEPTVTDFDTPASATGGVSATGSSGTTKTNKPKPLTIKAGPGVKATKNTTVSKKKSGKTVTYTTSIKGP